MSVNEWLLVIGLVYLLVGVVIYLIDFAHRPRHRHDLVSTLVALAVVDGLFWPLQVADWFLNDRPGGSSFTHRLWSSSSDEATEKVHSP